MSNKKCIYKNCTNTGAGEVTLFSFPKEVCRQNTWLELSGRSNHTLQKSDCICELHFGSRFISSNQRRKVLVGVAVPFNFDQNENDDEQQIEALDDCGRLDITADSITVMFGEDEEHQEEHQEDLDSYSSNSAIEHVTIEEYSPETIVCDQGDAEHSAKKRKIIKIQNMPQNGQPSKLIKIDVNPSMKLKNGIDATKQQHGKDDFKQQSNSVTIIDHPDVSIFNIRGEEFIQMPKSVYLEEKRKLEMTQEESYVQEIIKLREELHCYKNIVLNIKNQLKTLP